MASNWVLTLLGRLTAARATLLDRLSLIAAGGANELTAARAAALQRLIDDLTAVRAGNLDELDFDLQGTLATIAAYIDTEIGAIITSQGRQLFTMDFWSIPQVSVVVPIAAAAADQALPDVVVAALPNGMTVVKAMAMFKFRMLGNSGAANKLSGAQHIQLQKAVGAYVDAISLVDDQFGIAAATREGGDLVVGDHNVVAQVNANATYNLKWTLASADVAALTFYDVQVGLRIWYSV